MGLHPPKQEQTRAALWRLPDPERASGPANDALPIGIQAHDRPDLGKIEEVLRVDRGEMRCRELADQVSHRACRGVTGIDPSSKSHHHRWDVARWLTVKFHSVHAHPPRGQARCSAPCSPHAALIRYL